MAESQMKSQVLTEQMNYLCEELGDPGRYFPYLRSKGVLDDGDCQKIRSEVTSRAKTESFVEIISKGRQSGRGEHPFDVLVDALKKQKVQAHIARQLQKALAKIKSHNEKEKVVETKKPPLMKKVDDSSDILLPVINAANTNGREAFEIHPDHGPLPPSAPNQCKQLPANEMMAPISAEFGPLPPDPPPVTSRGTVEAQQVTNTHYDTVSNMEIGQFPPNITVQTDCELGPQSLPSTATDLKSFTNSEVSINSEQQFPLTFDSVTTCSYQSIAQLQDDIRNLKATLDVANQEKNMQKLRIQQLEQELRSVQLEKRELQDRIRTLESSVRPGSLPMHHKTSSPMLTTKQSPLNQYEDAPYVRPIKQAATYHSTLERLSASSTEHGTECTSLKSANSNSSINSYGSKNSYTLSASESLV